MRERYSPHGYDHPGTERELEHLDDLMGDFGTDEDIDVEVALRRIFERWQRIQSDIIAIGDSIREKVESEVSLSSELKSLALGAHYYLFDGILVNAGEYRKRSDPNRGVVYFGGNEPQGMEMKYEGEHPPKIDQGINEAFSFLSYERDESKSKIVKNATTFYATFVRVHPFYDANGRIGRLIMSVYLYIHDYYLDWKSVNEKKGKLINKLNACHDRSKTKNKSKKDKYRRYLSSFVKKFVERHSEFYDEDVEGRHEE